MLDGSWYSATNSHEIFQAFQPMYTQSLQATYDSIVRRWTDRPIEARWGAVDDDNVAWMSVKVGLTTVVFCKGLERVSHVDKFMSGVRPGGTGNHAAPFNEFASEIAHRIRGQMVLHGHITGQRVFLTGHSMGGSVAAALHRALQFTNFSALYLITIGEARTTSEIGVRETAAWNSLRWMTTNDPVCHMPPYSTDMPEAWLLFTRPLTLAVNELRHRTSGREITIEGNFTERNTSALPSQGLRTALTQWQRGFATGVPQAHNLIYYISALGNARLAEGRPPPLPRIEAPSPHPQRMSMEVANATASAVLLAQNQDDVSSLKPARGTDPRQRFFTYKKERGIFNVYWQGMIIASFKKKRGASRCCRRGNEFCRAYVRAFGGNDDQFNAAAEAFTAELPD